MRKILVVGDLNVDVIISGMTEFPELGREILCDNIQTVLGGSASIFACRLAQLGAKVDIFGKVGNDENGKIVLNTLKKNGVGTERVIIDDALRTGVTVSLTYPQDKALLTFMGSIGALTPSDIKPDLFRSYDHLHVSSIYFQPKLLDSLDEIFMEARNHGLTVSLDPQSDPLGEYNKIWGILKNTNIFLPNEREAKEITGLSSLNDALSKLSLTAQTVVIKRGSRGAIGRTEEHTVKVKALKVNPVDTTGAGDAFDAGFIYYYIWKKQTFKRSMEFANAVGALSCLYTGGAEGKITEEAALKFLDEASKQVGS